MNEAAENALLAAEVILESWLGQIAPGFSVSGAKKKRMNPSFGRGGVFIGRSGLVLWCPCKLFGSRLVFRCSHSESPEWVSTCPSPNKEGGRRSDFPDTRAYWRSWEHGEQGKRQRHFDGITGNSSPGGNVQQRIYKAQSLVIRRRSDH